jgi:hypothetical protein
MSGQLINYHDLMWLDKMGVNTDVGSAGQVDRTDADHDPNSVRRSTQTDENGPFASPVWIGPLEIS